MLSKAINIARGTSEEKVGVSFQMPKPLKESLDALCKKNDITLTSLFIALAQVAIDEDKNGDISEHTKMYNELKEVQNELEKYTIARGEPSGTEVAGYYIDNQYIPDSIEHIQKLSDREKVLINILGVSK